MSNIQKAFKAKAKRGLCMAAGGVIEQNSRPLAAPVIQGNAADLIQNPTGIQDSPGGGELVVMGHDPMADLNSLTPNTQTSNRFYGGHLGNDPHFSASTSRVMQERNLGRGGSSGSGYVPAQRNTPAPNLMTPVDDLFQPRRGLQLADGGVVGLLRNRSAAIDGAVNAASQPAARPAAPAPVAAALPSQASDYAAQAAAIEAEQLAAARAAAAPKPKQGLMSRLGFAQGGVVQPNMYLGEQIRASQPPNLLDAAGDVVDSLPYAAAQFVPGMNVPLGGAAMAVHAAQGRTGELPLDAAAMIPGGKGVLLAKGAKLAAKRAVGGLGRAANSVQALGAADAFGAPAYAQGGVVRLQGPGTGTSDDIPLTLRTGGQGMDINVSNGEGLAVLPAKTMRNPEAVEAVNDIIETTNGKPPRGLKAGASYADGMFDKVRAGVSGAANWVADKVAPAAAEAPATPAGGTAAPVAEAPSTPISAKTQAALRANMADQSLYGRTVEAVGNAKRSLERGAARVAASPYARELGRAATIVAAAGPAIENSLGENRIKPVGERTLGTDAAAGVLNSVDAGAKFIDNMASPITRGLNYAVKTFGGPENYFNDRALSNVVRRGIASTGEFTAPTTQNGEKVKIAGASSAPAQPAAIEPGAQERTFGASGAAPAPTPAAAADTQPPQPPTNDIQVRSIRGANGKMQPEFYGTNVKQTYTGADGKPTTNWYETQAYKDSQVQAAKDKELLKTYEKWGLEGDLKSNNPAYQARGLARQKVFNENAQTDLARTQSMNDRDFKRQGLEIQREDLGLRRSQEQRAIAAASRQAQLAAAEEGRKADEATSKKQDNYHKYLESVLTMPLTDSNGNVTNVPDARAIAEFTSKADATVAAMEEATRNTAEHSRWVDPQTKKPKSAADLDDTQKSWILNRFKAYQRIKQAQKGWATLGYADKFDTNDLSLLDGAEEGDYISFPKLKAKLGFVPRIQKKDLAYSDGPIGLTDLQLGKTPYDALTNNILGR